MEGNFITRYEKMLNSFDNETDRNNYILDCIPYMVEYYADTGQSEKISIFNTTIQQGPKRKDIYNKYLQKVEKQSQVNCSTVRSTKNTHIDVLCTSCNKHSLVINEMQSELVCTICGICTYISSEELTYKEEQETSEKIITYSYKRDNHFNEWILQFQAQEQTNIPEDLINQLRAEFKKQKIKSLTEITQAKVRLILKKIKMNKYYEHVPYITNILNGVQPPKMSQALEDKLRQMFKEIQKPFNLHCPDNRKNFLSYSYVLYKLCELLEHDEFLPYFPLLKAKDKLYQQDVIWKKICNELRWEFIPTL
jgi:hypothetical protein